MPRRWVELCATGAFWLSRGGSQESYGLPTPKFGLFGVSNLLPVLCLITFPCPLHVTNVLPLEIVACLAQSALVISCPVSETWPRCGQCMKCIVTLLGCCPCNHQLLKCAQ